MRRAVISASLALLVASPIAAVGPVYKPPPDSAPLLLGIDWSKGELVGQEYTEAFKACDSGPCSTDPNRNTVILQMPTDTVFFDAKMGLDTDGATFFGPGGDATHLPNTAWKLEGTSIDSNAVPYFVVPLGTFRQGLGVKLGDVAMVIYRGQRSPAVVADLGPYGSVHAGKTYFRLGEGSIALHEALGHKLRKLDASGKLIGVKDVSIQSVGKSAGPVLYFIFRNSEPKDLTRANLASKISEEAEKRFAALLASSR